MARLTKEQWDKAYKQWREDPKLSFNGLAKAIGVSKAAVVQYAERNKWVRGNVSGHVTDKKKLAGNVTGKAVKKKTVRREKLKIENFPIKDEIINHLHGNSRYNQAFDHIANKMCLLGATDAELADAFVVSQETIDNWKLAFPSFLRSIQEGKILADIEVANALYKRATGFSAKEVRTKRMAVPQEGGGVSEMTVVEEVIVEKEVAPETQAAVIWLHNRRPKNWRQKVEVEHSHVLDQELIDKIKNDYLVRLEKARERQRQVYLERGITLDADD